VVVVGVQEVCQCRGVGPQIGPFVEQGAVEALDLAVGLRPVGARELAGRTQVGKGLLPGEAFAVGPGVVGQDPVDAVDPVDARGC
jgi:hypothetical protein